MKAHRYYTPDNIARFFDKLNEEREESEILPVHYMLEDSKLVLFGTDNIGEQDEHSQCRIKEMALAFQGALDIYGHVNDAVLMTKGEQSNIRVTGYISGASLEEPVTLIAHDGSISLGDASHPERRTVCFAHIEAEDNITIYKRPLLFCTVISRSDDAVIRGQLLQHVDVTGEFVNINASSCKDTMVTAEQDVMLKGGSFDRCSVTSASGEVYMCGGDIRNCTIEARHDIELTGAVDEFTLANAHSEIGTVRHDGKVVSAKKSGSKKTAPKGGAKRSAVAAARA